MADLSGELTRTIGLVGLLTISLLLLLNVVLLIQNRALKSAERKAVGVSLSEGRSMPAIAGFDLAGRERVFEWNTDTRKTLLFCFSPRCGYCKANMPNWLAIIKTIDRSAFRVVMVSSISEGAKEYLDQYNIRDIPVLIEPSPTVLVDYAMHVTPQTVLLDPGGRIENAWPGVFTQQQKPLIEQALRLELPK